jgi:hypothetical protein
MARRSWAILGAIAMSAALVSCVPLAPSRPFDLVYLHRPDASTFEFIVCRAAEGAVMRVEFYARGDQLLETWRADSETPQSFSEGDVMAPGSPPTGFESDADWTVPDYFYTVELALGSEVDGQLIADVHGSFLGAEVSGSDWRDQAGRLIPPQC